MEIIGKKYEYRKIISTSDVKSFANISGDANPIHLNKEYAKQTIFKKPIVHGMLAASIISKVLGMDFPGPGTIYLGQELKFIKPIYHNQPIKICVEIIEKLNDQKSIFKCKTEVSNEENELVITGYATIMYPNK